MFVQCIVYCVQCTPSPLWLKSVPGWPAISVSTWQESRVGQIVWFGCLSAISQLASREGEGGGVRQLCLHSVTQPFTTWPRWREQGGGLCSLPLLTTRTSDTAPESHAPSPANIGRDIYLSAWRTVWRKEFDSCMWISG